MMVSKTNKKTENSAVFWIVALFAAIYLVVAPFYKGLFNGNSYKFEGPIYGAMIATMVLLAVIAIAFIRKWNLKSHRDVLTLLIWLIPLSFWVSSFGAASKHLATIEIYIKVMWAVFFVIGAYFAGSKFRASMFQNILVGSGYFIVLYGFMNWFGNAYFEDAILSGRRLSNVFQYPNAYAAFLMGLYIASLSLVKTESKWIARVLHGSMLVPILLSLLLTLSRGGAVVFPIVFVLFMIFLSWRKQLLAIGITFLSGIAALAIFNPMINVRMKLADHFSTASSIGGWLLLLLVSVIVGFIVFAAQKWGLKQDTADNSHVLNWRNFIIPAMLMIVMVVVMVLLTSTTMITNLLPDEIAKRIEGFSNDSNSVYQRKTFIGDALKIVGDYPLLGTGGGGWQSLYDSYKSYPYTSAQAHNFYVQYLVETGVIGTIILAAILAYFLYVFLRPWVVNKEIGNRKLVFFFFAVPIMVHSFLDFDMSYVYLSTLVMFALGASISEETSEFRRVKQQTDKKIKNMGYVRIGFSILLIAMSAFLLIQAGVAKKANSSYTEAVQIAIRTGDYRQFSAFMNQAVELRPNHPEYSLFKASILTQLYSQNKDEAYFEESEKLLEHIKRREPNHLSVYEQLYNLYLQKNDNAKLLEVTEQAIKVHPWMIHLYERAAIHNSAQGILAMEQGMDGAPYFRKVIEIRDYIEQQNESFRMLPKSVARAGKDFKVNRVIVSQAGKSLYFLGEYEAASSYLKDYLNKKLDSEVNKEIVRYYLASLIKQDQKSKTWTNRLYEADENEKIYLENLLQF